ncbi:DUF4432 family protein [Rhizobium mayense]|uniref:DUF4432 family protein n=1 Tax=Rhizobium mayense TaxID=1312184 RepID=A0ABT7K4I0_9HYPH|nr:DUF4432 family protein [Rhizobium mayense]MDL2403525.1 DUF4432 family protein [Rhizobium mayense]
MGSKRSGADAVRSFVGDLRQLASVRRIVLDDGPERGVQALAFSTGGGLDFWVLCDRSFDIGPMWWRGTPVAWQSPAGFANSTLYNPDDEGGTGFERLFSGFLVTCGLDNTRQPIDGKPLHGRLPFTPGRLVAHGEDWHASDPVLFCEGEVTQFRLNGERLRLFRRIEAPIGGARVRIVDRVQNIGGREEEVFLLYHTNFGFPVVAPGATVSWQNGYLLGPISNAGDHAERSIQCLKAPPGVNPSVRLRRPPDGRWAGLEATVDWDPATLPYLQVWTDFGSNNWVIGIEPVSTARNDNGTSGAGTRLSPSESRTFRVEYSFKDYNGTSE